VNDALAERVVSLAVLEIAAVTLREHGHKTPFSWILTGVIVVLVISYRLYRARRSRGEK
jgi:hypothetical protein